MKKSYLKSLIIKIIKESIEGVIQKGPDYNHKFDSGRYPVMGAVNIAENDEVSDTMAKTFICVSDGVIETMTGEAPKR